MFQLRAAAVALAMFVGVGTANAQTKEIIIGHFGTPMPMHGAHAYLPSSGAICCYLSADKELADDALDARRSVA